MFTIISLIYLLTLSALTIFSFSQVDIASRLFPPWFPTGQIAMLTNVGTNQKTFSGSIFVSILIILFLCFGYFWKIRARLRRRNIIFLFLTSCVITFFAYPGFLSHDIFSYMIYAKTLAYYRLSPWSIRPIDFPADPIVPYVHWQTSFSRYGPVWVAISALFYFLSGNNFWLAMWLIKLLLMFVFVGCLVFLYKLCRLLRIDGRSALVFAIF